jgi:hypothetical protein
MADKLFIRLAPINVITGNNRIYPKDVMEKAIKEAEERLKQGAMFVHIRDDTKLGGPQLKLSDVAGVIKKLDVVDDHLVCEVEALDNSFGRLLPELLNSGHAMCFPSGTGRVDADGTISDYKIESIGVQLTPENLLAGQHENSAYSMSSSVVPQTTKKDPSTERSDTKPPTTSGPDGQLSGFPPTPGPWKVG